MLQDFYVRASGGQKLLCKAGVLLGAMLTTLYLIFRAYYINFTPVLAVFSILLFAAEVHTIILMYGMLYSLWPRKYKAYKAINDNRKLQINMFITAAGEPNELVLETIKHAKAAADNYQLLVKPKKAPRVIVLDDSRGRGRDNWKELGPMCERMGVFHVAREFNTGFKAGNINNGLAEFPSRDPHNTIDCFFDSDFCAEKNFLLEILKPMADNSVDFVQSPQRYKNLTTWVANAAGAHQIFFFDYICPAKAADNALFLCGTNYAIRRKALLDAGGVEDGFVTEDYATSIRLHLAGKRGVFLPTVLAYGMAPMNLKEYFNQQTRWCKGCLDANGRYAKELFFGHLTPRQKFHYFLSTAYYFIGIRDLILVLAPVPYLFWGISLIRANTWQFLSFIYLPLIAYNFTLFFITFRSPIKSLVLDLVAFPVFAMAFVSSVVKYNLPFTITIKKYEKENPFRVYKIQLAVAAILVAGLVYSWMYRTTANATGRYINYFWAMYDAIFLLTGFYLVVRENISGKLKLISPSWTFNIPAPMRRYAFATVQMSLALMIFAGASMAIPVAYDRATTVTQEIVSTPQLALPNQGAYYGYYLPTLNTQPVEPNIKLFEGDSPSLAMYYQDWAETSKFNSAFMNKIYQQGAIPIVTWEPWDTQNSKAAINDTGMPQKMILGGYYDEYIKSWARAAKNYDKPMFLRFAHEMNGNWYPWAGDPNGYTAMWKHVHDIFVQTGATNVIWVWSPNNTDEYGETAGVMDYYPGKDYTDWTGFSAFNWGEAGYSGTWNNFDYIAYDIYNALIGVNKPIMIAEMSSSSRGGDKTGWFYQTLGTYVEQMPAIKAVVLYNEDYKGADFDLNSGMDAAAVIGKNILENPYFLKQPVIEYK